MLSSRGNSVYRNIIALEPPHAPHTRAMTRRSTLFAIPLPYMYLESPSFPATALDWSKGSTDTLALRVLVSVRGAVFRTNLVL